MKHSEVIDEILVRCDEAYIPTARARAKRFFHSSLAGILVSGEYSEDDIIKLKGCINHTVADNNVDFEDISASPTILRVLDVYATPDMNDDTPGIMVLRASLDEIRRYSHNPSLRPAGSVVKWDQVGRNLRFWNGVIVGKDISVIACYLPPDWVETSTGASWEWHDNTEMSEWIGFGLLMQAIEMAAGNLRAETNE